MCDSKIMDHQYTITDDNDKEYNPDQDKLLIDLVQAKPHLYDKKDANFRDFIHKNDAWEEIAETLNMPVEVCMNRWHRIRERFTKFSKFNETAEMNGSQKKAFPFYDKLMFLSPHIKRRKRCEGNVIVMQQPITDKEPATFIVPPSKVAIPTIISSGAKPLAKSQIISNKKLSVEKVSVLQRLKESGSVTIKVKRGKNSVEKSCFVPNKIVKCEDDDSSNTCSPIDVFKEENDNVTSSSMKNSSKDSTDYFALFVSEKLKKLPEDERKEKKKKIFAILME